MGAKENIERYIEKWEKQGYENGIPDEAPIELERKGLVPSYRMICIALMRNPNNLEVLGFKRQKSIYYQEIKRIEIDKREFEGKQIKLFK